MKVTWVEFNWNVPYFRADGKQDYKRTFRSPEHTIAIHYTLRMLFIDGLQVGIDGAVWKTEETIGSDQPSGAASPARSAKQKRQG